MNTNCLSVVGRAGFRIGQTKYWTTDTEAGHRAAPMKHADIAETDRDLKVRDNVLQRFGKARWTSDTEEIPQDSEATQEFET